MKRFETPKGVAEELAKHAPQRLARVLDPSVGAGALLFPLMGRFRHKRSDLYCVDSDPSAISELKSKIEPSIGVRAKLINDDFLDWSQYQQSSSFDCILMNPPFAAKQSFLRKEHLSKALRNRVGTDRFMPVEAAFVCRALELLKVNGRLLSVLPSSIVMSQSLQWLRDLLMDTGAIRYVHELPPRTFPNVESRMYLLVYDKGAKQRKLKLVNHDLKEPHHLHLWLKRGVKIGRLDFGHYDAVRKMSELIRQNRFRWRRLGEIASVMRGDVSSPIRSLRALHTSDFRDGFWHCPEGRYTPVKRENARLLNNNDLLLKRVGRNSSRSVGRYISDPRLPCSDCVLIIRPNEDEHTYHLLFALKVICQIPWVKPLLERGTGASYISKRSLLDLPIPTGLHKHYTKLYASFVEADRRRSDQWYRHVALSAKLLARYADG